jgi:hypothetical protein
VTKTTGCCGQTDLGDRFERLATFDEIDKERPEGEAALAEELEAVRERGRFDEDGGTLSDADFDEARAALTE